MTELLTKVVGRALLLSLLLTAAVMLVGAVPSVVLKEYVDAVLVVFPILTVAFLFMNWDLIL